MDDNELLGKWQVTCMILRGLRLERLILQGRLRVVAISLLHGQMTVMFGGIFAGSVGSLQSTLV